MQQVTVQEEVEYASVGWRFAAVLVDTAVLLGIFLVAVMVWAFVLVAQGRVGPQRPRRGPGAGPGPGRARTGSSTLLFFGALFVYYTVLEGIFGASVGKLAFRMRVVMLDGSRPTGVAIVVRNLIRVPEAWLLYIPSGISCLASSRRQRLGDHAARTTVVRRRLTVGAAGAGRPAQAPPGGRPAAGSGRRRAARTAGRGASAGSHRRLDARRPPRPRPPRASRTRSERSRRPPSPRAAPTSTTCASPSGSWRRLRRRTPPRAYSEEYVSAWFTLADAVASLRDARAAATAAAVPPGQTLDRRAPRGRTSPTCWAS